MTICGRSKVSRRKSHSPEQHPSTCAASDDYRDAVDLLRCFRRIDAVTAMTVPTELCNRTRAGSAPLLISHLGRTPGELGSRARLGPRSSRSLPGILDIQPLHISCMPVNSK